MLHQVGGGLHPGPSNPYSNGSSRLGGSDKQPDASSGSDSLGTQPAALIRKASRALLSQVGALNQGLLHGCCCK